MYGDDILTPDHKERALIGNYQKLGLFRDNILTILSPDKSIQSYKVTDLRRTSINYQQQKTAPKDAKDTITYYQSASYLYKHKKLTP